MEHTDVAYNLIFNEGDRLVIQLKNEHIFEGDYCGGTEHSIDLENVRQHNNPNELGGLYSFYRIEIDCIYYFKETRAEDRFKNYEGHDIKRIDLSQADYNRFYEMTKNCVYLTMADDNYYKAVAKLKDAENVGVIPFGIKPSQFAQISVLAVCTWKEVFLFNMRDKKNRYLYPELKEIFESEAICKVMHKGGPLVDILFRSYKVYVQNTFDTEVVDLILRKTKTGQCPNQVRSLSNCVTRYINLPTSFLNRAREGCEKSWANEPLENDQLNATSQLATCLMFVKHKMERLLLRKTARIICKAHSFYAGLQPTEYEHVVPPISSLLEDPVINEEQD